MKRLPYILIALFAVLSACSPFSSGDGVSTPYVITAEVSTVIPNGGTVPTSLPPTPLPTLAGTLSITELKYRVLDEFPDFFFCDPDFYPVAREDELVLAKQRFPDLQANLEEFQAILIHNGLDGLTSFTDEQKLLIYREHKRLNAIFFELTGDAYRFQIQTGTEGQQGTAITATIDGNGSIDILQKEQGFPMCPICLAAGTLVDTPRGPVRVEELRVGDPVWTLNEAGERLTAMILKTGRSQVPASHQMIHVKLEDGRELWASPGHPTTDDRVMDDLAVGDMLNGSAIIQLERVPYADGFTFDILPDGDTGFYWANGIVVDSTLHP